MAQDPAEDPIANADASAAPPPGSSAANSTPPSVSAAGASTPGGAPAGSASSWQGKRVSHFRIVGFLGRGAMGRVFRAEDLSLKRHVALKVFPTILDQGKRKVRLERFIREARSAASLDHPGIVHVYEADEFRGWYYIAQELVEGGTVGRLLEANGPFDVARACQIGAEVGEALEFAHDHGVIHRDVKPDNIMLARGGRAKLADFGLAFRSDPSDQFHVIDEAVGTAYFMAPEICRGHGATPLSDQYSLAATMWALLTGAPPFAGATREEVMRQQINAPIPSLRKLRPDVPQGLAKAIERALAKQPEDRYPMAEQFAKVLRVYTIGGPSASQSGSVSLTRDDDNVDGAVPAPAGVPFWQRKEAVYVGGGVLALAIVGVLIGVLAGRGGAKNDSANNPPPTNATPANPAPVTPAPKPTPPAPKPPTPTPAVAGPDVFIFAGFENNTRGTFDFAPAASGSTQGILPTSTNTIVRDPERGLVQQLKVVDDPAKQATPDGTPGWFIRHISGHDARPDQNTPRPTRGWVGLWLRTASSGLSVSLAIDDRKNQTNRGKRQAVFGDDKWHCYEWNLEDAGQWEKWLNGTGTLDPETFTLDAVQFWGPNADATILIDDVSHNATGKLPNSEPAAGH